MATQEEAEKATSTCIEEYVQMHWDDQETVCYFSALGVKVKHDVPESLQVLAIGLHNFLRQNPIVQVIQYPGIDQKIGAVPLSVTLPQDLTKLFEKKRPVYSSTSRAYYDQEFWDAFIKPIEKTSRYVCIDQDGGVTISDDEITGSEVQCYEVFQQDLTDNSAIGPISERVASTHGAINSWLEKHSLDRESFAPRKKIKLGTAANPRLVEFLSAFDGISHEDLTRIEIPLDILVKLNSNK